MNVLLVHRQTQTGYPISSLFNVYNICSFESIDRTMDIVQPEYIDSLCEHEQTQFTSTTIYYLSNENWWLQRMRWTKQNDRQAMVENCCDECEKRKIQQQQQKWDEERNKNFPNKTKRKTKQTKWAKKKDTRKINKYAQTTGNSAKTARDIPERTIYAKTTSPCTIQTIAPNWRMNYISVEFVRVCFYLHMCAGIDSQKPYRQELTIIHKQMKEEITHRMNHTWKCEIFSHSYQLSFRFSFVSHCVFGALFFSFIFQIIYSVARDNSRCLFIFLLKPLLKHTFFYYIFIIHGMCVNVNVGVNEMFYGSCQFYWLCRCGIWFNANEMWYSLKRPSSYESLIAYSMQILKSLLKYANND